MELHAQCSGRACARGLFSACGAGKCRTAPIMSAKAQQKITCHVMTRLKPGPERPSCIPRCHQHNPDMPLACTSTHPTTPCITQCLQGVGSHHTTSRRCVMQLCAQLITGGLCLNCGPQWHSPHLQCSRAAKQQSMTHTPATRGLQPAQSELGTKSQSCMRSQP